MYYNKHLIIDDIYFAEQPRAWEISKVNRVARPGVVDLTFYQTEFDEHKDYIERDSNGNIIGMWAGYYDDPITPTDADDVQPSNIHAVISYPAKAEIKIGGKGKKFTVKFYDGDVETTTQSGTWSVSSDYTYDSHTIDEFVVFTTVDTNSVRATITDNASSRMWINKSATITFTSVSGIVSTVDIAITSI